MAYPTVYNPHSERDWDFYLGNSSDDDNGSLPAGTKIPKGMKVPTCNWRILYRGAGPLAPHLEAEMMAWEAFVAEQKKTAKAQGRKRLQRSASYNEDEVISLLLDPEHQAKLEAQKRGVMAFHSAMALPQDTKPAGMPKSPAGSWAAIAARRR